MSEAPGNAFICIFTFVARKTREVAGLYVIFHNNEVPASFTTLYFIINNQAGLEQEALVREPPLVKQ